MAVEPKSAVAQGAAGPYESRVTRPEDKEGIRQLFQEVFKDEMTEALWQWKYERPESKGAVVLKGGKIVAHYGGLGRWVLREGIRCLAVQIGDVMVAAGVRHSVRSNSPFFLVFTTFAEAYLGFDKLFPFAFGFPNVRAYRIAEQLGRLLQSGSHERGPLDSPTLAIREPPSLWSGSPSGRGPHGRKRCGNPLMEADVR